MRIGVLSDVHVHRHDQLEEISALIAHIKAEDPPDVLVLAGDVSHRTHEVERFLGSIDLRCAKCWIPGNHDIWVIEPESESDSAASRYRQVFPRLSVAAGWHYLPNGPVLLDEQRTGIVGTIGWFTGPGYSEWFDASAGERDEELAVGFAEELDRAISSVPSSHEVVVVTHHLSHRLCPCYKPTEPGRCNQHIEQVLDRHRARITLLIHGHKHVRHGPTQVDGYRVVAHPFGYPGQHGSADDGYRVLDLSDLGSKRAAGCVDA